MSYAVLPALAEHIPHLGTVERSAATRFPPGSIPDAVRDDQLPTADLEAARARGWLWVAVPASGGPPVGFALLRLERGLLLIGELDVHPAHGRRGLGRRLLALAAGKALTEGHRWLYLTTFAHIPWNAPFYAHLGFEPVDEVQVPALASVLETERSRGLEQRIGMRLDLTRAWLAGTTTAVRSAGKKAPGASRKA